MQPDIFSPQIIQRHQQHLNLHFLRLAHIQNDLLQFLLLPLHTCCLLDLLLQLQVLPLEFSVAVT